MAERKTATLDQRFYPHLVDIIFEAAPDDSLLVMSRTCKAWFKRAAALITHVRGFGCFVKQGAASGDAQGCVEIFFQLENNGWYTSQKVDPGELLLPRCTTIDLGAHVDFGVFPGLKFPALRTVRIPALPRDNFKVPPNTTRVVFDNYIPWLIRGTAHVKTLVLNHRQAFGGIAWNLRYWARLHYQLENVREVVYVFDTAAVETLNNWLQAFSPPALHVGRAYADLFAGVRLLWAELENAYDEGGRPIPLIVVGAERLSCQHLVPSFEHDPMPIFHETLVDYRESVGEKNFLIETEVIGPTSPLS